MEQLSMFDEQQPEHKTGFYFRKRLYDAKGDYRYTAIPIKQGYRLIPISLSINDRVIIELSQKDYKRYILEHGLKEVIPKVKKVKGMEK